MNQQSDKRQWPDNIVDGPIRYGRASNYDGFYLADADHGIPTIGSVSPTETPTIRGQFVQVFNYPGQTEAIAKQICDRWNAFPVMLDSLKRALETLVAIGDLPSMQADLTATIAKAEGRDNG